MTTKNDRVAATLDPPVIDAILKRLERQEITVTLLDKQLGEVSRTLDALRRASRNVTPDEKRRLILDRKKLAQREYRRRLKEARGG